MLDNRPICSKCGMPHTRTACRYCNQCHAAYMRAWRKTHPVSREQRLKGNARGYAGVYKRRGVLQPKVCRECGSSNVEMHHSDYSQPLAVEWLCRSCHLDLHLGRNRRASHRSRSAYMPSTAEAQNGN